MNFIFAPFNLSVSCQQPLTVKNVQICELSLKGG
jgi:hypothetical protein